MTNLSEIPAYKLELELLLRSIARANATILAHETALAQIRKKQARRQKELARQLAIEMAHAPSPPLPGHCNFQSTIINLQFP